MTEPENKKNQKYYKNKNYNLFQSFRFAFEGIVFAMVWERNLRIHLLASLAVAYFSLRYYHLSRAEYAVLVLAMSIVITCELFNTAIEKAVDLFSPNYSWLAKIAKDVAAGAVLVSAVGSLILGVVLLGNAEILSHIIRDITAKLYIWIPIAVGAVIIIFGPELNIKKK